MNARICGAGALGLLLSAMAAGAQPAPFAPITNAVHTQIDGARAFRTVDYVQRRFRLPGNEGFDLAIDTVASLRRAGVKWGLSLDMVGENTALTGGTFLIEKMLDPSAVWVRGEDQHSEWGVTTISVQSTG
ncbi:hypothetical protein [Gemmatimonas sp.]|uniref:hypothetical protein n=1 Tax=Gemmatimonas sp. TaxID=1962908 RepID=UPI0031C79446|nr:hypothetical protein [Gemmatimonas sp.]